MEQDKNILTVKFIMHSLNESLVFNLLRKHGFKGLMKSTLEACEFYIKFDKSDLLDVKKLITDFKKYDIEHTYQFEGHHVTEAKRLLDLYTSSK